MVAAGPYSHGPHRYTLTDARRTLSSLEMLWMHHSHVTTLSEDVADRARLLAREIERTVTGLNQNGVHQGHRDPGTALGEAGTLCATNLDSLDPVAVSMLLEETWTLFSSTRTLNVEHRGKIASMHAGRGLPKPNIESAEVTWRGITGDVRRARTHHGRPQQALCVWSTEALDALAAEGHPIEAGCAGDNITIEGIPRAAMRPGARLMIGEVEAFVSSYTIPCAKNSQWFSAGDFMRMHHERGDESRLYAMITATGRVSVGDDVVVISDR